MVCYTPFVPGALLSRILMTFDRSTQSRGQAYARRGHVIALSVQGRTAEARVIGTRPSPYQVTVACPVSAPERLRTSCSCPLGTGRIPCKHIYAVIQLLDQQHVDLGAEGRVLSVEAQDPGEVQQSLGFEGDGAEADLDAIDDDDDDDDERASPRPAVRSLVTPPVVAPRRTTAARGGRGANAGWRARLGWIQYVPARAPASAAMAEIELVLAQLPFCDERGEACVIPADLRVAIHRRSRKRDGTLAQRTMFQLGKDWSVSASDRALIELLLGCTPTFTRAHRYYSYSAHGFSPRDAVDGDRQITGAMIHPSAAARVLPALCASGRLQLDPQPKLTPGLRRQPPAPAMREPPTPLRWDGDEPFTARLRAQDTARGIALSLELVRGDEMLAADRITAFASTSYLIAGDRLIRVDGCDELARWFVAAGREPLRLPSRELAALVETIGGSPRAPELVLDALGWTTVQGTPVPRLYLEPLPKTTRLGGRLVFRYGEIEVATTARGTLVVDPDARRVFVRAQGVEADARAQLASELGWIAQPAYTAHAAYEVSIDTARFVEAVPKLQDLGWELWVRGSRLRRAGGLKVRVESDIDWFGVSLDVDVEGIGAELPELLRALREAQPFVRLTDGSMGLVLPEWLAQHRRLATLGKPGKPDGKFGEFGDDALRVPRAAAPLLDAMLATLPDVEIDAALRKLRTQLATATEIKPRTEPRSFRGALRPYQREGLGWFRFLDEVGLGGCLADDMGLGKTVQVLALLAARRAPRPSLVIAPKTVVFNWLDEARRFAPQLRVLDYTGPDRAARRAAAAEVDLIVTSYPILRLDCGELSSWELEYVILDEAQAIKNPDARVTEAARLLRARRRLALTGTPVENHLGDLASILEFLNPGLTDSSSALRALLAASPEGAAELAPLSRALRPFLLRRTKEQVLPDLPTRTEQVLRCELGADQRRQYSELLAHYRAALLPQVARDGMARSTMHVLEALLRLRQAACHPGLLDRKHAHAASAKLDTLLEHMTEATESGHKALIFSQFTSFLALLRARLDADHVPYEYLDGQTRDRKARVTRFQTDLSCKLFLISLKAGGSGLNLTAADYVYLLDPWWNPAVEAQAIDRSHRSGQTRPVLAYRLIAEDTIEDKILELQARKRQLADGIFADDGGGLAKLSLTDLELLFS